MDNKAQQLPFNGNRTLTAVVDYLLSVLWVGHMTVTYWRGTWTILDVYLFPDHPDFLLFSGCVSLALGAIPCSIIASCFPIMGKIVPPSKPVLYLIVTRILTYIMAYGTVAHWRGIWYILDHFFGVGWVSNAVSLTVGLVGLWILRSSKMVVTPPLCIGMDTRKDFYQIVPRFQSMYAVGDGAVALLKYCLDHTFSQLIIVSLVTVVWRSLWNVFNDALLPDDAIISNVTTLLLGYFCTGLAMALQKPLAKLYPTLENKCIGWRILVDNLNTMLGILACIAMWRGYWNLIHEFVMPPLEAGGWFCHVVGYFGCLVTGCTSSLYGFSYRRDGERQKDGGGNWYCDLIAELWPMPASQTDDIVENGTVVDSDMKKVNTNRISTDKDRNGTISLVHQNGISYKNGSYDNPGFDKKDPRALEPKHRNIDSSYL